jgi:hypothetical protein
MVVKIGHASIDENGKAKGGKAGDQNAKEVKISNYYVHSKGWVVLRCKDDAKREKIAEAMEKACKNSDIGYDQNQRDTLYNNVKNSGFDPSKTTKKVETDCSALVRICIAYAYGSDKVGNIRTVTEPAALVKTGLFTKYTSAQYCKSSDYLKRGDILCTPVSGHTVVVLNDGAKVSTTKDSVAGLEVDGEWGKATTKRLQQIFGTPVDGVVSNQHACYKADNPGLGAGWEWKDKPNGKGSQLIKAMQKWAGMPAKEQDGEIGTKTIKAFQSKLGTTADGKVSNPSQMVKALQKWANKQ